MWTGPRFKYTGQAALPEASLYHYKARVYDPVLGRFLQTDPVGYEDDLNLYAYVYNDPMNETDPSGAAGVPNCTGSRLGAGCEFVQGSEARSLLMARADGLAGNSAMQQVMQQVEQRISETVEGLKEYVEDSVDSLVNGEMPGDGSFEAMIVGLPPVVGGTVKVTSKVVTKTGTVIRGVTRHGVDRLIGDGALRAGVKPQALLNAMRNPIKVIKGIDKQGRPYEIYVGEAARVVVNPETGRIISANPLSQARVR